MSNFANKVTSAAPCHTVFVRTKRKRFAYVTAGNGQDRVSCVVGGGVRCSQQDVGGESLPIPQPVSFPDFTRHFFTFYTALLYTFSKTILKE